MKQKRKNVLVSPSILSADFANLGRDVRALQRAGADMIHVDVMDGHFVPNFTFGPPIVKAIRPYSDLPFDVHLMMAYPSDFIDQFATAGADIITVHLECCDDTPSLIAQIKKHHKKVGLSIKPHTKVSDLIPYLPDIDQVLIMSVEPGFGGQAFEKQVIKKIAELKALIGRKKVQIEVDGGITDITAPACVLAGADILVAGSYIFGARSKAAAIEKLKGVWFFEWLNKRIPQEKEYKSDPEQGKSCWRVL